MANNIRFGVGVKDDASGPLDRIRDKFEHLQKQGATGFFVGAGAAATTMALQAVGGAVQSVGQFIGDSIGAASDLAETLSKVKVVFKDAAGQVEDFGEDAATAMGMSKEAALAASAQFGLLFTNIGLGVEPAAEMSDKLVQLGADLASFNNIDPTDALLKLRSGLAGEAEPLRSMGIFLSEAKVKAKAMELGLVGLDGQVSESAKVQARYKLILEETTTAQGDFDRTSEGLANQQRTLKGRMEDLSAEIGEKLLPVALALNEAWLEAITILTNVGDASRFSFEEVKAAAEAGSQAAGAHYRAMQEEAKKTAEVLEAAGVDIDAIMESQTTKTYNQLEASRLLRFQTDDTATATGELEDATKEATEKADRMSAAEKVLRDRLDEVARKAELVTDKFRDLGDAMFDGAQLAGEMAEKERDLAELLSEEPARRDSEAWIIWAGKVAEAREDLFLLQYQMKQSEGPEALLRWLQTIGGTLDTTNEKVLGLYASLLKAAEIANGIPTEVGQAVHAGEVFTAPPSGGTTVAPSGGTTTSTSTATYIATLRKYIANLSAVANPTTAQLASLALYRSRLAAALNTGGGGGVQEFASGGTVLGPIGSPQLAVVHGGEEITPPGRSRGGPVTIVMQLNGRELGRAVLEELDFRRGRGTFLPA